MIRLFAVYKDTAFLARLTGYNAEHLKKVKDGHRPLSKPLENKLRAALEANGIDTDGMFDEIPEPEAVAS